MCTDDQHHEKIALLKKIHTHVEVRQPIDSLTMISASQAYVLDYKNRHYVYMWTPNALTLIMEDMGQIITLANSWTDISLITGMKIYASSSQTTAIPILIRCTDYKPTPPPSNVSTSSSTATPITSVAAAAADTSLLAANTNRKGGYFYNDSTAILYLSYGTAAASTTSYTVQIPANNFFEMPTQPIYTGAIRGIWASATGNARITELS